MLENIAVRRYINQEIINYYSKQFSGIYFAFVPFHLCLKHHISYNELVNK